MVLAGNLSNVSSFLLINKVYTDVNTLVAFFLRFAQLACNVGALYMGLSLHCSNPDAVGSQDIWIQDCINLYDIANPEP